MDLQALFQAAADSPLGETMRNSALLYPAVETVHLIGLASLLGGMLVFNLRYFGLLLKRQSIAEIAHDLTPWTRLSLIVMLLSGIAMFASRAPDLYAFNLQRFLTKMGMVVTAVIIHYAVQRPLARSAGERDPRARALAAGMLVLWFATALQGLKLVFL